MGVEEQLVEGVVLALAEFEALQEPAPLVSVLEGETEAAGEVAAQGPEDLPGGVVLVGVGGVPVPLGESAGADGEVPDREEEAQAPREGADGGGVLLEVGGGGVAVAGWWDGLVGGEGVAAGRQAGVLLVEVGGVAQVEA